MPKYKVVMITLPNLEATLNDLASAWRPVLFSTTTSVGDGKVVATVILERTEK